MAAARPLADCIDAELLPGPDITSDEALIDDIRRRSGTVYHPVLHLPDGSGSGDIGR
jgi:choline dehydrogenase